MIRNETNYVFQDTEAKKPTWRVMYDGVLQIVTFSGANAKGKAMSYLSALQDGRISFGKGAIDDYKIPSPVIRDVADLGQLNEPELPDDYPVYPDYLYVADGKVIRSPFKATVAALKKDGTFTKVQRCDIVGRGIGM